MSFQGKLEKAGIKSIRTGGRSRAAATAGTSANILILFEDASGDILLATGTDVPSDATTGYAKGCLFIDRNVATGTSSLYENIGTNTSCVFSAFVKTTGTPTEVNVTAAELDQLDSSANISKMTPGAQITTTAETYKASTIRVGNVITTEIYIDITGLSSIADDGDVIGFSTGKAHIGRVTTAVNGLLFSAKVACVEVPATGLPDINIASASVDTGKLDDDGTGLTNYILDFDSGGNLAVDGEEEWSTMPIPNSYLYLLAGAASGAGTYSAGKLVITLKGLVV